MSIRSTGRAQNPDDLGDKGRSNGMRGIMDDGEIAKRMTQQGHPMARSRAWQIRRQAERKFLANYQRMFGKWRN